jgi:hypothetical protein
MTVAHAWPKGRKSPGLGVPLRHVRDKAMLLLGAATEDELRTALIVIIATRPEIALDALCEAADPDRDAGEGG